MKLLPILALAATIAFPTLANAQYLLDTGTPTGGLEDVVSSASQLGVEFSLTAGENLQQISLYLTPNAGNNLDNFLTLELYSANITARNHLGAVDSFQLEYTQSGWNSVAANYTVPTTGTYWLTVATASSGYSYDAQTEASNPSGTAPATAFAFSSNSGSTFTAATGTTASFGVQIGVAAAPEPSSWVLAFVACGLFFALRRSRSKA